MLSFQASSLLNNTNVNSNSIRKLKALIVDDDTTTRMILKAILRQFDVESQEAKNGQEAILVHHSGACFDLILMDLYMPIMNGRQATKELRDMHVCSLIVGLTVEEKEDEKKSFMNAGLDCCYEKPLSNDAVQDLVEKIKRNA